MNSPGFAEGSEGPLFPAAPEDRGRGSLSPRRGDEGRVKGGEGFILRRSRGGLQTATLKERARELRKNATPSEVRLWEVLRGDRMMGLKFRRQHQIGPYIVDFACIQARVVIELLGGVHDSPEAQAKDAYRRSVLNEAGYRVLEIPNEVVIHFIAEARSQIHAYLSALALPPPPPSRSSSPLRGERDPRPRSVGAAGKRGRNTEGTDAP